jgi:CBS domain-containing protein
MKARDIMRQDPLCCTPTTTVQRVALDMLEHDCGCLPVVKSQEDRSLMGVITDRDITCRVVAQGKDCVHTPVGEVMTAGHLWTVGPEDSIETVADVIQQGQVRRVLVVDESDRVQGIISMARLTRNIQDAGLLTRILRGVTAPTVLRKAA